MLVIEGLSSGYGESRIVSGVTLGVKSAQVVCLMGRNGVGKSTLLKTIMGLLKVKSGRIQFDGRLITKDSPNKRAQAGIGYVPQGRGIFPYLNVHEKLLMGFEVGPAKHGAPDAMQEKSGLVPVLQTMQ